MQLPLLALPTASGTREPDPDHLRRLDGNGIVIDDATLAEQNDPATTDGTEENTITESEDPRVREMVSRMEPLLMEGRTPRLHSACSVRSSPSLARHRPAPPAQRRCQEARLCHCASKAL